MGIRDFLVTIPHIILRRQKLSALDGKFKPEIDELRSEFGAMAYINSAAVVATSVQLISTSSMGGRKFHIRNIEFHTEVAGSAVCILADSTALDTAAGSSSWLKRLNVQANGSKSEQNLKGLIATAALTVLITTQPAYIEVGGVFEDQ